MKSKLSFCECGCEEQVSKIGNRFILGHQAKTKEGRENMRRVQQDMMNNDSYVNGFYGKHHSKEWGRKIGKGQMGNQRALGYNHTEEAKKSMSREHKKLWQNPNFAEERFAAYRLKPNKPERRLRNGLNKMFPGEYKFVGDGKVWIAGKNPDFININGQKKIIELFGDYWHSKKVNGRTKVREESQRIKHFAKYGFRTLIIWQRELQNIKRLKRKLIKFHKAYL